MLIEASDEQLDRSLSVNPTKSNYFSGVHLCTCIHKITFNNDFFIEGNEKWGCYCCYFRLRVLRGGYIYSLAESSHVHGKSRVSSWRANTGCEADVCRVNVTTHTDVSC